MLSSCHRLSPPLLVLCLVTVTVSSFPAGAIALPSRADALVAQTSRTLPSALVDTLKQDVHQRTHIPIQQIRLFSAQIETWPDSCLGLAQSDQMCSQALVTGWRVVLRHGPRRWVYRTNQSGSTYRLEALATPPANPANPPSDSFSWIPEAELPPRLQSHEVFRVIVTGGFAGRTTQTILMSDGRMLRTQLSAMGTPGQPQVHHVSAEQMRQFQALLRHHSLKPFHRHAYPAPAGSADVQIITLSGRSGTVRYAETQQQRLPVDLQLVIQAWNDLNQ